MFGYEFDDSSDEMLATIKVVTEVSKDIFSIQESIGRVKLELEHLEQETGAEHVKLEYELVIAEESKSSIASKDIVSSLHQLSVEAEMAHDYAKGLKRKADELKNEAEESMIELNEVEASRIELNEALAVARVKGYEFGDSAETREFHESILEQIFSWLLLRDAVRNSTLSTI